jgi:hypothetical protein
MPASSSSRMPYCSFQRLYFHQQGRQSLEASGPSLRPAARDLVRLQRFKIASANARSQLGAQAFFWPIVRQKVVEVAIQGGEILLA